MGVAVTSGVLSTVADIRASINGSAPTSVVAASSAAQSANQGNAIPSPDSSQLFDNDLETLPDAYIATVHREESARRLAKTFKGMPGGAAVKVQAGGNVEAVKQSDVVLLWWVAGFRPVNWSAWKLIGCISFPAANHKWLNPF